MKPILAALLLVIYTFNANAAVMLLCSVHQEKNSSAMHSHDSKTVHACCVLTAGGNVSCAMVQSCGCSLGKKRSTSEKNSDTPNVFVWKLKAISALPLTFKDTSFSCNCFTAGMYSRSAFCPCNYQPYPLRI